jgi:hypothetical protein
MADAIKDTMDLLAKRLDALREKQTEEIEALQAMTQRIENAKMRAKLMAPGPVAVALPQEKLLEGFVNACIQRRTMCEAMAAICTVIGSIVVQLDNGEMKTLAGKSVIVPTMDDEVGSPLLPGPCGGEGCPGCQECMSGEEDGPPETEQGNG